MKPPRPKICKAPGCEVKFTPTFNTTQQVCSPYCSVVLTNYQKEQKRLKKNRAERKAFNENDPTYLKKQAEKAFNAFIRLRDQDQPCISCDAAPGTYRLTAGHYRTKGAAGHLRFNEDNVHGQCWFNCNKNRSGNITEYRPRLVAKIGCERVEAIETNNVQHEWTIDELRGIIAHYRQKTKDLKEKLSLNAEYL